MPISCRALARGLAIAVLLACGTFEASGACECFEFGRFIRTVELATTRTDVLTVNPAGTGETLADAGIRLRIRIVCTTGGENPVITAPLAGYPAEALQLFSPALSGCAPWVASGPSDADGWVEFRGPFAGGGCVDHLQFFAGGELISSIPIRINSPDTGVSSPGIVDGGDLATLAAALGQPARYTICLDFNEDGLVDAGDVSCFTQALGAACALP